MYIFILEMMNNDLLMFSMVFLVLNERQTFNSIFSTVIAHLHALLSNNSPGFPSLSALIIPLLFAELLPGTFRLLLCR